LQPGGQSCSRGRASFDAVAGTAFEDGRVREECRQAWLPAYQIMSTRGEFRRAARCAARIGFNQLGTGEIAQAVGCLPASMSSCSAWVTQGSALLEHEEDCAEHGFLLVPVAYEQLVMEGNPDGAASTAAQRPKSGVASATLICSVWRSPSKGARGRSQRHGSRHELA